MPCLLLLLQSTHVCWWSAAAAFVGSPSVLQVPRSQLYPPADHRYAMLHAHGARKACTCSMPARARARARTRACASAPTPPRAFRLRGRSGLASLRAQAPPAAGARLCGFGCVFTCTRMCDGVCARTQGVCVCMCVCMCMCMCMCVCARAYAYVVMRAACERAQATYKGTYKAVKPWLLAWFLACRILSFCVCRILLLITPVLWRVVFFYDACVEF